MPYPAYTAAQVREAEAPLLAAGFGEQLMRCAAGQLAAVSRRELAAARGGIYGARAAVLTGPGNNGGDALHAAADLAARGVDVTLLQAFGQPHPGGLRAARAAGCPAPLTIAAEPSAALRALTRADLVIDGILGTGGHTGLPEHISELFTRWQAADTHHQVVIAVDVPTGIDASTGASGGVHVCAHTTVTFGGAKTGLFTGPGAHAAGRVHTADIGLDFADVTADAHIYEHGDLEVLLPRPQAADHKYTRGVVGICAGSTDYPGAAVLCTAAAAAAGAGMVRVSGDAELVRAVLAHAPEAVTRAGRVQAWAVGPGSPPASALAAVLDNPQPHVPVVADAGALDGLSAPAGLPAGSILTPHAGELARLLSRHGHSAERADVEAAPLHWARTAAQTLNTTVLLKGHRTVIAEPDGIAHLPAPGAARLATAGSGDVLTGVLAALLAARAARAEAAGRPLSTADAAQTAAAAVLLHGAAGHRISRASTLIAAVEELTVAHTGCATGPATGCGTAGAPGREDS